MKTGTAKTGPAGPLATAMTCDEGRSVACDGGGCVACDDECMWPVMEEGMCGEGGLDHEEGK